MAGAINAVEEVRELAMTEHRRWCYAMVLQGWRYAEEKKRRPPPVALSDHVEQAL